MSLSDVADLSMSLSNVAEPINGDAEQSGDNIQSVQIVCNIDQNSMKAIPLGCVLDQSLVNRNIASVGERQETTIPTTAEARRLAAALELFL